MPDRLKPTEAWSDPVVENPWSTLQRFTTARIGLGRAGVSLPTRHHLSFQLAHARARDAVHSLLDTAEMQRGLERRGFESIRLQSAAPDRHTYLLRPDLGRRLDGASAERLRGLSIGIRGARDIALVIADGLSAAAVQQHALPLLDIVVPKLVELELSLAPVAVVTQGRVAIADEIGSLLNARLSVILIGERPGLSAHDSIGLYLTYEPRPGRTDAERNCVSNVRAAGLSYDRAAAALVHLVTEAVNRQISGVALKGYEVPPVAANDLQRLIDPETHNRA